MWTTNDQVHFLLWLACIFTSSLLAWEHHMWEYHLNSNDLLSFGCCLLARSTLGFLQLSISNVPRITTSMLAFQVPHLVYLHVGGKPLHLGRSDLSPKSYPWYSLKITWLIDPSDGLNLMSNLDFFFKTFSFYLFKSFSFYQMISNHHLNLNFIFNSSLILIFILSTKSVQSTLHNQIALYSYLVMLLDHLKTNLGTSITLKHVFNLRTFQSKWL